MRQEYLFALLAIALPLSYIVGLSNGRAESEKISKRVFQSDFVTANCRKQIKDSYQQFYEEEAAKHSDEDRQ